MMNTPFTATDHSLHPHCHARPPGPVLQQGQCLLLTLMSSIPMASIHSHSVSHGDYKLHCFFQLSCQSMVVIQGTFVECEFLPFPKGGHTLFCSGIVPQEVFQILYLMGGDPLHHNCEYGIFFLCSHPVCYM